MAQEKMVVGIRNIYKQWSTLHEGGDDGISSLREFSAVLGRWQKYGDFKSAVFRGEPDIYDSVEGDHDTFLISRIARRVVLNGQLLHPYTRHTHHPLNLSREEIENANARKITPKSAYHYRRRRGLLSRSTRGTRLVCWILREAHVLHCFSHVGPLDRLTKRWPKTVWSFLYFQGR